LDSDPPPLDYNAPATRSTNKRKAGDNVEDTPSKRGKPHIKSEKAPTNDKGKNKIVPEDEIVPTTEQILEAQW
jgi:hypothetical protein